MPIYHHVILACRRWWKTWPLSPISHAGSNTDLKPLSSMLTWRSDISNRHRAMKVTTEVVADSHTFYWMPIMCETSRRKAITAHRFILSGASKDGHQESRAISMTLSMQCLLIMKSWHVEIKINKQCTKLVWAKWDWFCMSNKLVKKFEPLSQRKNRLPFKADIYGIKELMTRLHLRHGEINLSPS